jgi:serine/threonine protein kinase/Tol biopolymer transport system component
MPLSAGTKLGPYQIIAPIGVGGMGEVYRAIDTKLNREVAIKVLPDAVGQDPERLARFEREAKVLASLNHPNIAQIYGVEERALVMELVQGDTLKGPLPLATALNYAKQIAGALEAAHEKGIIHRDLKPSNIMITPDEAVKVLDFGLAAVTQDAATPDPANSPTLTMSPTRAGMIMGTAAYMSPEQARGKPVDKRSDIWSFGVVIFETLSGKPLFRGETVSDILAAVLTKELDWSQVPVKAQRLLRRCLERDPKQRLRDIGEARFLLDDAPSPAAKSRIPLVVTAGLALITFIAGIAGGAWWYSTRPIDHSLMRLDVDLGPDSVSGRFTTAVISPDGSRLVFPMKSPDGKQTLATRLLSEAKPVLLPGTESGRDPFFSPDGEWIGFFADAKMKKISVRGGAPVVLCDATDARGADWGEDGNIVANLNVRGAVARVPAEGGPPREVTKLQADGVSHRWPQTLPGGEAVLFTISRSQVAFEDASIAAAPLKTGETKILVRDGYFGRYVPSGYATGHLVYVHQGVLFGVPFDPVRLELRGTAVPLFDDVGADPGSGAGNFSFTGAHSKPGILVYRAGKVSAPTWPVLWLENLGKTQPLISAPGMYMAPRFSPDGQRLAVAQAGANGGIFVYDLQRDTRSHLIFDTDVEKTQYPTWSPDGQHLAFRFLTSNNWGIGWIRADGAGETQRLLGGKGNATPYSFFPDGKRLAYSARDPDSGWDIWTVALDVSDPDHPKAGKPEPFLRTLASELRPAVSGDGRWIAYQSDESGVDEIYVRPFPISPGGSGKWQISTGGGTRPVWSRKGRELFFENLDNRIMSVAYELKNESFVVGKPHVWSNQKLQDDGGYLNYDVAPNGKRLAIFPDVAVSNGEKGDVRMTFLLNFFDELRRRAPVSR